VLAVDLGESMPFSVAYPLAVLVAGSSASFTDWLFMGLLFHSHTAGWLCDPFQL
jgi:hypothetical protein